MRDEAADATGRAEEPAPRVLVMLASYNGGELLHDQVETILSQEGVAVDLLISDDGSTDGTVAWCEALAATRQDVSFHRNEANVGCAWNFMDMVFAADPEAHDYFAFADQDDRWLPGKLARGIEVLRSSGAELYYGGARDVDLGTGEATPDISRSFRGAERDIGACLVMNWALGCTMVFTPALLRRLQERRPAELPRYHDNWVHEVALATMTTAPDLQTIVMDHVRTGGNESGHTRLDRLDLQRLKRVAHFIGRPRRHEIAREARQLLACYGEQIHPEMLETVELVARLDHSFGARLKALFGSQVSVPLKRENLLLKARILLNYL